MLGKDDLAKQVSGRQETHFGRCVHVPRQAKFCLALLHSYSASNFKD